MSDSSIKLPPKGSFPFFEQGKNLFTIWAKALDAQTRIWNEQWVKLKDGTYKAEDWYSAMVRGTELSASTLEEMFFQITGDPHPPWVSLAWNSKDEITVKSRVSLAQDDDISVSALSALGYPSNVLPTIEAVRVDGDSKSVKVWLTNPGADFLPGEYVGFVMRSTSPKPVAIVTVTRPKQNATSGGG